PSCSSTSCGISRPLPATCPPIPPAWSPCCPRKSPPTSSSPPLNRRSSFERDTRIGTRQTLVALGQAPADAVFLYRDSGTALPAVAQYRLARGWQRPAGLSPMGDSSCHWRGAAQLPDLRQLRPAGALLHRPPAAHSPGHSPGIRLLRLQPQSQRIGRRGSPAL